MRQAGHGGFITGNQLNDGVTAVVQFLDATLYGNTAARNFMHTSSGLQSRPNWTVQRKGY